MASDQSTVDLHSSPEGTPRIGLRKVAESPIIPVDSTVTSGFATYFNGTFNRSRLQLATRWQAYRPEEEYPRPLEADADGEHGQPAIYNGGVATDAEAAEWQVTDDCFHTAGSLYLWNQDLWISVWGGSEFPGRGVSGRTDRLPQ